LVDYNDIFLEKIGQIDASTPSWSDARIEAFLDTQAYLVSRNYATPWADFDSVPDRYQYPVTIYAAIQFWWGKAGEFATKFDVAVGGGTVQKSTQLFYRALEMIDYLKKELEEIASDMLDEGSPGDIIVGDLVKRSKYTGYLVPRSDDPAGDWTS
jgi:hypothetical protein